ncbi:pentapeptide repeat-containing protein [Streptomyces sp. NPDC005017]|uniref:pentapeptide repeat-containing protein n=1 Tax=Streptomyces sp. NPDC005017 TaxID=3364706 RepID=UPI0036C05AD1
MGSADFESATFEGCAAFTSAIFEGQASFISATFYDGAEFRGATFNGYAWFAAAVFRSYAEFVSATFHDGAGFGAVTFTHNARLSAATFKSYAWFGAATFKAYADLGMATFEGEAGFPSVAFEGEAAFASATFKDTAEFGSAAFEGDAEFRAVTFEDKARFRAATFKGAAWFEGATFQNEACFEDAAFQDSGRFQTATFQGHARFASAAFESDATFASATFRHSVEFRAASFGQNAGFEDAAFDAAATVGPLVCSGRVLLSGAMFGGPVTLAFAAHRLECRRTRWSSTAEIRLRYATVDFAHAVFEYPLTIAAEPDPFGLAAGQQLAEDPFAHVSDPKVRLASLRGVDAAHLVLADVDLSACLLTGTVHLDQLRLEGACLFGTVPPAVHWRRGLPLRFTQRRTLAEEHHWRASQPGAVRGWNTAVLGAGHAGPLQLAPVYRALRKAFEDGKHEPGAADFYYGEMEMRRHADDIPRSERGLLTMHWALSGYGLRASRALAWLGAAMLCTIVTLMAVGLPSHPPKQTATGTVPSHGGRVTLEIDKDDPRNPTGNPFSGERFEKALNITLNSVVFRSTGQDLTTAGTYIEMTARLTEPVLLGLAILGIRNRLKR